MDIDYSHHKVVINIPSGPKDPLLNKINTVNDHFYPGNFGNRDFYPLIQKNKPENVKFPGMRFCKIESYSYKPVDYLLHF